MKVDEEMNAGFVCLCSVCEDDRSAVYGSDSDELRCASL